MVMLLTILPAFSESVLMSWLSSQVVVTVMLLSRAAPIGKRSGMLSDIQGGGSWRAVSSSQADMYRTKLRPHSDDHFTARHVLPPHCVSPTSGHSVRHVSLALSVLEKSPATSPARTVCSQGGRRSCGCTASMLTTCPAIFRGRHMAGLPSAPAAVV